MTGKATFLDRMVTAYGDIFEVGVKHKRSWFMIANPSQWEPTDSELGKEESYSAVGPGGKPRKNQRAFKEARPGDRVFIYVTAPRQYLWGLGRITAGLIETDGKEIRFANDKKLLRPVPLQTMKAIPVLADYRPLSMPRGSLFAVGKNQAKAMLGLVNKDHEVLKTVVIPYGLSEAREDLFQDETFLICAVRQLQRCKNVVLQALRELARLSWQDGSRTCSWERETIRGSQWSNFINPRRTKTSSKVTGPMARADLSGKTAYFTVSAHWQGPGLPIGLSSSLTK